MNLIEKGQYCKSFTEQDKLISQLKEHISNNPKFSTEHTLHALLSRDITDFNCRVADLLDITINYDRFAEFWNKFFEEGIHPTNFNHGLFIVAYFLNHYPKMPVTPNIQCENIYPIIFYRIEKCVIEYPFEEIQYSIITVLTALAPIAPLRNFLSPGLFDSVLAIFMNRDETFEISVQFLDRMFHRSDSEELLDNVIMNLIILLANYSPPKKSLWHFLCFFLKRFSYIIAPMCDFDSLEENGLMPIFTRSLIWTIRLVVQNPPEQHSTDFWEFCCDTLQRYKAAEKGDNFRRLYDHIWNEMRLSILYSFHSAVVDFKIEKIVVETLNLLMDLGEEDVFTTIQMIPDVTSIVSVGICCENDNYAKKFAKFAEENQIQPIKLTIVDQI